MANGMSVVCGLAVVYRQRAYDRAPCLAASRRGVLVSSTCPAAPAGDRAATAASAPAREACR
jgi:hypothetical protein